MLIAVNFHYVRPSFDAPYPGIHGLTPEQFEAQLTTLARLGEFVSLDDVRACVHGSSVLPPRALLITFDDGLREQYSHAWPVLQRLGIPAVFFTNTAPLAEKKVLTVHKIHILRSQVAPDEILQLLAGLAPRFNIEFAPSADQEIASRQYRYDSPGDASLKYFLNFKLDWQQRDQLVNACFSQLFGDNEAQQSRELYMEEKQIRELCAAGCIGSHAHDHLPLGLLNREEAARQIEQASQNLEKWTGRRPFAMSYPYGSQAACTPETGEVARECGIEFAFSMERATNVDFKSPLFLSRFDSNDVPGGKSWQSSDEVLFESVEIAKWYRP
jgi:peptidoglycan/xylan/chitin deacetylase (PgdA/CDA1 family)